MTDLPLKRFSFLSLRAVRMKDLVRAFVERAESQGGEEWMRRCLALSVTEDGQQNAEVREAQPVQPSPQRRARRSVPPERLVAGGGEEQAAGWARAEERRSMAAVPRRRSGQKRRTCTQSPARRRGRGHSAPQEERQERTELPVSAAGSQATATPQRSAPQSDLVPGALFHSLQTSMSVPAGEVSSAGQSELQKSTVNDILGYLSAISHALSAAGIASPILPPSLAVSPSGSDSASFKISEPVNVPAPVSFSQSGSTHIGDAHMHTPVRDILSVPEACLKGVMPCEISPLGYNLPSAVKEKIWWGDFVEVLSLLPTAKEFNLKSDKKGEQEEDRRRTVPRSFNNWLQAFFVFASVLVEKHPELSGGLFQHLDHVLEAYKNFGGLGWYAYDESFRQKLAVHPSLRWGMKDVGLWLNLILPQGAPSMRQFPANPGTQVSPGYCRGWCFSFNESQCRFNTSCKYRHECSFCAGPHPVVKCFRKTAVGVPSQRDIFPKSLHASEAGKHAPLAGSIPKQGESAFTN